MAGCKKAKSGGFSLESSHLTLEQVVISLPSPAACWAQSQPSQASAQAKLKCLCNPRSAQKPASPLRSASSHLQRLALGPASSWGWQANDAQAPGRAWSSWGQVRYAQIVGCCALVCAAAALWLRLSLKALRARSALQASCWVLCGLKPLSFEWEKGDLPANPSLCDSRG